MKLYQTIRLSDADTAHGYITIQYKTEALFWLSALCEYISRQGYAKKESSETTHEFTFKRGEIGNLHTYIDKYMRSKDTIKFPSVDFMEKYTNYVARSKDNNAVYSEISDFLAFLAPLKNFIEYIEETKALIIKFEAGESA